MIAYTCASGFSGVRVTFAICCPSSSQPAPARSFGKGVECGDDLWRPPDATAWAQAGLDDDACVGLVRQFKRPPHEHHRGSQPRWTRLRPQLTVFASLQGVGSAVLRISAGLG